MPLTDHQLDTLRRMVEEGGHTQTAMARTLGCSQAAVSRALAPPTVTYPHTYRGPIPGPVAPPRPPPQPPRPRRRTGTLVEDLELRIAGFDETAARALEHESYTAATHAQSAAARLRLELETQLRLADERAPVLDRDGSSDAALIERLVAVVEHLPDEAYERLEDAVYRRRGRSSEVA